MLLTSSCKGAWRGSYRSPLESFLPVLHSWPLTKSSNNAYEIRQPSVLCSTLSGAASRTMLSSRTPFRIDGPRIRTILSSSSFSALPEEEEAREKSRVDSLTPYQKEMELRKLDSDLARLQTLRAINTGELYTFRGKFKMLSRDYGMGFLAWYWTVWFATAALSYGAIELGGVDPLLVAARVETFMGWEPMYLQSRLDPTLGQVALVVAVNECLEPLRLPFVVITTKPVVKVFSKVT